MNVLYVTGACLTKNTSANMSHNGYVQGLLENGCHVDILMAKDSWGQEDAGLPIWPQANYFSYESTSLQDRLQKKLRGCFGSTSTVSMQSGGNIGVAAAKGNVKSNLRAAAKKLFYYCFPTDPLYSLEHTWLKKAANFRNITKYDLVISNSSPAASHKMVGLLLEKRQIKCDRWIQIWEDPWFLDLYAEYPDIVGEEEHSLLRAAHEVYYVSPLTLDYQKQFYPDCAHKMKHVPLPFLNFVKNDPGSAKKSGSFGYFGDYYSQTRNLEPFYDALKKSGMQGYIYGNSNLNLASTEQIVVSGRVTLDVLAQVQAKTEVLIHLSNLKGGQIPGKIYHYSATGKPILFILDGTQEEQDILRSYFGQFNRYYFCENREESILSAIRNIQSDICSGKTWSPVAEFSPKEVVAQLF
ncbi:MAG: hypothetical protein IJZ39_07745 [Oscillospiraceae bacterium]|nr:hypothetical protein [Oscillospiraceae bacterium]